MRVHASPASPCGCDVRRCDVATIAWNVYSHNSITLPSYTFTITTSHYYAEVYKWIQRKLPVDCAWLFMYTRTPHSVLETQRFGKLPGGGAGRVQQYIIRINTQYKYNTYNTQYSWQGRVFNKCISACIIQIRIVLCINTQYRPFSRVLLYPALGVYAIS